jgi:hypothetical protein
MKSNKTLAHRFTDRILAKGAVLTAIGYSRLFQGAGFYWVCYSSKATLECKAAGYSPISILGQ